MADLTPGTVLHERFEILGVVGRGGTATVYLAMDRLREHRIALKVVHPHLANDPSTQRRLRSEVQASAVVRHPGALVPYDLHELDRGLALALPFHPGQTLSERMATGGALSPDGVRALGVRLAEVLAVSHRAGVLHRDVTANNVLLGDDPAEAVLTDFGLARVTQLHRNRTTGLLGTAGYAAPEVYAGERADPRSDLYGLGAVLYLAATGKPAFDPAHPVGGLRQQLDEKWTPIQELRPGFPDELANTIYSLLRREPEDRPQGAREVADALERRVGPAPTAAVVRGHRQYLPAGKWTVVVRETDEDASRRKLLRVDRGKARNTAESEIVRWGKQVATSVRDALGIPAAADVSPEDLLADAIAEEAGLAAGAVIVSDRLLRTRFRLIDATDASTARRLAETAKGLGFKAHVAELLGPPTPLQRLLAYYWVPIALVWVSFPFLMQFIDLFALIAINVAISVVLPIVAGKQRIADGNLEDLPVAYGADLVGALGPGEHAPPAHVAHGSAQETGSTQETGSAVVTVEPSSRGEALRERALVALKGLDEAIDTQADALPDPALRDLRGTVADLRDRATRLGLDVDRLSAALDADGSSTEDVSWMRDRLDRLRTMERAGDVQDPKEVTRLSDALAQHDADTAAAERVQTQLTASSAQLLEIASTASRVRRELLSQPEPARSADALVERLRSEARAAEAARTEADEARRDAQRRLQAARKGRRDG